MPYLSRRALEGLKQYKYKPAGYTFLDDFHQPFWNYLTEHVLPPWLAPNLITLTGLCALLSAYCLTAIYLPDFVYVGEGPAPRWIYFSIGSAVFFYLHMDALDGKQARKTKTSSPLGQLFDHGCDALAVYLIMVTMMPALQLTHEWRAIVGIMYVFVPWWLAHWEEYHTGMMLYGNGAWGVTEANYAVVAVHFVTVLFGGPMWKIQPLQLLLQLTGANKALPPAVSSVLGALTITDFFLIVFGCMGLSLGSEQILRVFRLSGSKQVTQTTMPKAEQGHKTLGRSAAASHLMQILGTAACGAALLSLPAEAPGYSRIVMTIFGVTYAMQATRLIMAHMSKEPFSVASWPLVLMGAQVANHFLRVLNPVSLAYAVHAVVLAGYLHYVISIVGEICAFLRINALTIPTR